MTRLGGRELRSNADSLGDKRFPAPTGALGLKNTRELPSDTGVSTSQKALPPPGRKSDLTG